MAMNATTALPLGRQGIKGAQHMATSRTAELSADELRAKAARLDSQAAAMKPGVDSDTVRAAAAHYAELAAWLEASLVAFEAGRSPPPQFI